MRDHPELDCIDKGDHRTTDDGRTMVKHKGVERQAYLSGDPRSSSIEPVAQLEEAGIERAKLAELKKKWEKTLDFAFFRENREVEDQEGLALCDEIGIEVPDDMSYGSVRYILTKWLHSLRFHANTRHMHSQVHMGIPHWKIAEMRKTYQAWAALAKTTGLPMETIQGLNGTPEAMLKNLGPKVDIPPADITEQVKILSQAIAAENTT